MNPNDRNIRVTRLQDQGNDDLLSTTTAEERVAMMWQLAIDPWTFMATKLEPEFPRHVVRIVRRSTEVKSLEQLQAPGEDSR